MTSGQKQRVWFTAALLLLSVLILVPTFVRQGLPANWPSRAIRLGLDLKGGSYLVLGVKTQEAVVSQLNAIAASVRAELKKEKIGLISAKAQSSGGPTPEHSVQFSLLNDRGIAKLDEFMAQNYRELSKGEAQTGGARVSVSYKLSPVKAAEIEKNAVSQALEIIRNRVDQYGVAEPTIQKVGETGIMVQMPEVTNLDQVKKTIGSVAKLEFRLQADPNRAAMDETVTRPGRNKESYILEQEVAMTGDAVETANVEINPDSNEREVTLKLTSFGKETFGRITSENVNRNLAIILDGVVQSAPVIRSAITGGTAQITGGFTPEEASQLALVLRSGALPASLSFEEERTVGASLGADSIRKGIIASAAGALLVVVFIMIYYRKSGVLAVASIACNILFLLTLLSVLRATLTLPGLAGLALTIGMAVDANIIIYERIREELRNGATAKAAIEAGFNKAHWTILDANITTLLAGLILYGFSTGPVRGFAVTLSLGIFTTLFAALFITKLGFAVFGLKNSKGELSI